MFRFLTFVVAMFAWYGVVLPVFSVEASEPIIMLTVNGGDTSTFSINDSSVRVSWYISGATDCEISPDIGPLSNTDDLPEGYRDVVPARDTTTTYVLTCANGGTSAISIFPEPTVTSSVTPDTVTLDMARMSLSSDVNVTWSSEAANYCKPLEIKRLSDGLVTLQKLEVNGIKTDYGPISGVAKIIASTISYPSEYEVTSSCVNQYTGEVATSTQTVTVVANTDIPDPDFTYKDGDIFSYTPSAGYDYVNPRFYIYPSNVTTCGKLIISSENDPYSALSPYVRKNSDGVAYRYEYSGHMFFEDATLTLTCTQTIDGVTKSVTHSAQVNFTPRLDAAGELEDPFSVLPTATVSIYNSAYTSPITDATIDPVLGYAPVYAKFNSTDSSTCYIRDEVREDGYKTYFANSWETNGRTLRKLSQPVLYSYKLVCGRRPSYLTTKIITATSTDTVQIHPADTVANPPLITEFTPTLVSDEGSSVWTYSLNWQTTDTTSCSFSAIDGSGEPVALVNLQSDTRTTGVATENFINSGDTYALTLTCGRLGDTQTVTEVLDLVTTGFTAESPTPVASDASITTGECFDPVTSEAHSPIPAGYTANNVGECVRLLSDYEVGSLTLNNNTGTLRSTVDGYDNATLSTILSNIENGLTFAGEVIPYTIALDYNYDPTAGFQSEEVFTEGYNDGLGAKTSTVPLNQLISVPFGIHRAKVSVNLMGAVLPELDSSDDSNIRWFTLSVPFPTPNMNFTAERLLVAQGGSTKLMWEVESSVPLNCTVEGKNVTNQNFTVPVGVLIQGSTEVADIRNTTKYVLRCSEPVSGMDVEKEVLVNVVPLYDEQ